MEPPSYEEARVHPPVLGTTAVNILPPPSYDASLHSPPTPPPTYGEAVTAQQDAYPVLTVPTDVTPPFQNTGSIIHPVTQIGRRTPVGSTQTQPPVVVTQPQPVPILVAHLVDSPGLVQCPHCQHVVTTDVSFVPGKVAWGTCVFLALMGLICGFCLIPLMIRGLQDAHHTCPQCGKQLHVYKR